MLDQEQRYEQALKWLREGAKAFEDGLPREAIPYPWQTYAGMNWLLGYDNASITRGPVA